MMRKAFKRKEGVEKKEKIKWGPPSILVTAAPALK